MFQRLTRVGVSFAIVPVSRTGSTALIAVPLIEPQAAALTTTATTIDPTKPVITGADRYSRILEKYFPPGSWQLATPKVLESEQAMLVVKDYKNLPDGRVELRPCTMIFFPKESGEVAKTSGRAIVLDAPGGAILEFDEPFDLKRQKSASSSAGSSSVRSRLPAAWAAPTQPTICRFSPAMSSSLPTASGSPTRSTFASAPTAAVAATCRSCWPKAKTMVASERLGSAAFSPFNSPTKSSCICRCKAKGCCRATLSRAASHAPASPSAAVEVTCQGPLYFDLPSRSATFRDHVEMPAAERQRPERSDDVRRVGDRLRHKGR